MKLRNKKTGEIAEASILNFELVVRYDDGRVEKYPLLFDYSNFEYYEEPRWNWYIDWDGEIKQCDNRVDALLKFETKEEAERAVKKLKALTRLKDKGFRFDGWEDLQAEMGVDDLTLFNRDVLDTDNIIGFRMDDYHDCIKDLNICFGGEE